MEGLISKYRLEHIDGTPVDPRGAYFVLKMNSQDLSHRRASLAAARAYAADIRPINPELASDLVNVCSEIALPEMPRQTALDLLRLWELAYRTALDRLKASPRGRAGRRVIKNTMLRLYQATCEAIQ